MDPINWDDAAEKRAMFLTLANLSEFKEFKSEQFTCNSLGDIESTFTIYSINLQVAFNK